MKYPRQVFFLGAVWELIRFVLIFLTLAGQAAGSGVSLIRILWFGSSQLALAMAFVMIGSNSRRFGHLCRLLAASKIVTLVPGIALIVILIPELSLIAPSGGNFVSSLQLIAPFVVLLIDIIILVILLTYRGEDAPAEPAYDDRLPDYHETEVEDT
jgi:hypothetical protein